MLEPGKHIMQLTFDGNGPSGGMGNSTGFAIQPVTQEPRPPLLRQWCWSDSGRRLRRGREGIAYWNGATTTAWRANYRPAKQCTSRTAWMQAAGTTLARPTGDWLNYTVNIASSGLLYVAGARPDSSWRPCLSISLSTAKGDALGLIRRPKMADLAGRSRFLAVKLPQVFTPAVVHGLRRLLQTVGIQLVLSPVIL